MKFDFWWLTFTEKGKGVHFSKLVGVEGGLAATATFRDLEQQGGKDNDDQKNSDPRQGTVHML